MSDVPGQPTDRFYVGVQHLPGFFDRDAPDAVHSVAASGLQDYLETIHGGPMPHGEAERALALTFYEALGALSTDESVHSSGGNPWVRLPKLVGVTEAVVFATNAIGERVDAALELPDSVPEDDRPPLPLQDVVFLLGLHDIGSFAIARELRLPHPRMEGGSLLSERMLSVLPPERAELATSPAAGVPSYLELMLSLPNVGEGMKRRIRKLLETARVVVDRSTTHHDFLRQVTGGDSQES